MRKPEDRFKPWPGHVDHPTGVSPENVLSDLAWLGEDTSTGEYGYYKDEHGQVFIEVWNDSYHGTKAEYRVKVVLEKLHGTEGYDWIG